MLAKMPNLKSPSTLIEISKTVKRDQYLTRMSLYFTVEVVEFINALSIDFDH